MTKILSSIRSQISTYYHLGVLLHHLFIAYYMKFLSGIEKYKNEDRNIQIMMDFRAFYFTGWNFVFQCIYFTLSLIHDILDVSDTFHVAKKNIEHYRNYIFRVFVFPVSLGIYAKFWILYLINPNLIFPVHPKVLGTFFPSWLNHALHTHIVTVILLEILITCHYYSPGQSQKKEVLATLGYVVTYITCFSGVYIFFDIWLYPVYAILSWLGRICLATTSTLTVLGFYKLGAFVSNTRWEYDIHITQDTHKVLPKKTN